MNRDITNTIRFFLDEFLPPIIRKNKYFMYPMFYVWYKGKNVSKLMEFKKNLLSMTEEEYINYYVIYDAITSRPTDLNMKSIDFILENTGSNKDAKIIDIGCGNGYLLKLLKERGFTNLTGSDIIDKINEPGISFKAANIEKLPFENGEFDIVICSHTLEHVIHLNDAINEVKRLAKNKIIITVPCQAYNPYTFDLHVNFFPQQFDLQRILNIKNNKCVYNDGDWSFVGHLS